MESTYAAGFDLSGFDEELQSLLNSLLSVKPTEATLWFLEHGAKAMLIARIVTIVLGLMTIVLSTYLLACFVHVKEIKGYIYSPFAIQTFCHLVGNGVALVYVEAIEVFVELDAKEEYFQIFKDKKYCVASVVTFAAPDYSTGLGMVALAVQRFILVVKPFEANQILTENYYKAVCFFVASVCIALTSAAVGRTVFESQPRNYFQDCQGKGFYGGRQNRGIIDSIIFLMIPAAMCIVLYAVVAVRLWKQQSNVRRNRQLSILFMTSCFVWILLCLPVKISFMAYDPDDVSKAMQFDVGMIVTMFLIQLLYPLFSTVSPIIFIACCPPTQVPLRKAFGKLFPSNA